jgi:8-oxo-dGTP diphosphatase
MKCEEALDLPKPDLPSGLKIILVAAAALVDPDGRILLAQRPEGKSMAGLWEFPGGKVNAGETPEYALMRELEEELGIETRPCCFSPVAFASHSYPDFHLLMPLFMARVWRGIPQAREHAALAWVRPGELYNYPMPAADIPLIASLRTML